MLDFFYLQARATSDRSRQIIWHFFFALQAHATSDRSRQLRRQDKVIQYSVHKEAYWESYVSLRKSQLASQVQK